MSKRASLWTQDGRLVGEIADDAGPDIRIITSLRGKDLIREAVAKGGTLVVRGPDRTLRVKEKRVEP